jgi:hypothetical protein
MTRTVTLHLNAFGEEALERLLETTRASPERSLRKAAIYYLSHRGEHRRAWRARRFRPVPRTRRFRPEPAHVFDLRVAYDDETWSELEEEAARQKVTPEELAVHALMYFLADVESGRAEPPSEETTSEHP